MPVMGAAATQNIGAGGREEGNGSSSEDEEPTPRQSKDNEYPASSRDNPLTARLGDSSDNDYKPDPFYDLSIMSRESGSSPGSSNLSRFRFRNLGGMIWRAYPNYITLA
jgi:hypothetical protein